MLYRNIQRKRFKIFSFCIDSRNWKKAIKDDSTGAWQHILDDTRIGNRYSANSLPVFFLIDKDGKTLGRYSIAKGYGEKAFFELAQDLKKILEKK